MNVRIVFEDETAYDHAINEAKSQALREFANALIEGKDPETDTRIFDPWDVADLAEEAARAALTAAGVGSPVPAQVDATKLAEALTAHQAKITEGGSFDGCVCGFDFDGNDGWGSGHPAHQASKAVEALRGGAQ